MHNTRHWLTVFNQRDIDGDLAITGDKFAGAIKRINKPVTPPLQSFGQI
jgi:hypothetical protein